MNNQPGHHHTPHLVTEVEESFRRGPLKFLLMTFAALVIGMSLTAPKHVQFVLAQPQANSSGIQQ